MGRQHRVRNVPASPSAIPTPTLNVLDVGGDEAWRDLLTTTVIDQPPRFTEGVDFDRLFSGNNLLILADTNHEWLGVQRGLVERLPDMRGADVKHLLVEVPENYRKELEDGKMTMNDLCSMGRISHRVKDFLEGAEHFGINVEFIDMSVEDQVKIGDKEALSFQRGVHMGGRIRDFVRDHPDERVACLVGLGHTMVYDQIPKQLDDAPDRPPYKVVGLMCEGQRQSFRGEYLPLMQLPVATAVASVAPPGHRFGYIDLGGVEVAEDLDGLIFMGKPTPVAPTLKSEDLHVTVEPPTEGTLIALSQPKTLIVPEEALTKPAFIDWGRTPERMDPQCRDWRAGNEEKIVEFAQVLADENGLNKSQMYYMGMVMLAYCKSRFRHHMGGSLKSMGFVPKQDNPPQDARFEFESLDLFGYDYGPSTDYSNVATHDEVSYNDLMGKYGFTDLSLEDAKSIPEVTIMPADNPKSVLGVNVLAMAALTHPERVAWSKDILGQGQWLRVYYQDMSKVGFMHRAPPSIVELTCDDFALTPREEALRASFELVYDLRRDFDHITYSSDGFETRPNLWQRISRRLSPKGWQAAGVVGSYRSSDRALRDVYFEHDAEESILLARKKLAYVGDDEFERQGKRMDAAIPLAEDTLREFTKYHEQHPWTYTWGPKDDPTVETSEELIEKARVKLEQLKIARGRFKSLDTGLGHSESLDVKNIEE